MIIRSEKEEERGKPGKITRVSWLAKVGNVEIRREQKDMESHKPRRKKKKKLS